MSGEGTPQHSAVLPDLATRWREGAFPTERLRDDGRKIVEARLPAKRLANALRLGHNLGRIARTAPRIDHREIDAGDALNRV